MTPSACIALLSSRALGRRRLRAVAVPPPFVACLSSPGPSAFVAFLSSRSPSFVFAICAPRVPRPSSHCRRRALSAFGARDLDIDTEGYKRLMHILGVVSHDTWQLFEDMHTYNPYAQQKRQAFIDAMTDIHERLSQ